VSLLVWKIEPCCANSRRISLALTMLPLWQMPICPRAQSISSGWAFDSLLSPAVEYRVCPNAIWPGNSASVRSSKISLT
jgi:hypothetical protein